MPHGRTVGRPWVPHPVRPRHPHGAAIGSRDTGTTKQIGQGADWSSPSGRGSTGGGSAEALRDGRCRGAS